MDKQTMLDLLLACSAFFLMGVYFFFVSPEFKELLEDFKQMFKKDE